MNLQRERQSKGEIKVGITYDGWKKEGKDRYALDGSANVYLTETYIIIIVDLNRI